MDADMIVFICFLAIFFLILSLRNKLLDRLEGLNDEIRRLQEAVDKLSRIKIPENNESARLPQVPAAPESFHSSMPAAIPEKPNSSIPASTPERPPSREPATPPAAAFPPKPAAFAKPATPIPKATPPPKPGFFERHPDLEKFIGENLVSKIGIAVLVLAIGFFVKYAIDNDWIGPAGRVGIGLLCGGILIGLAHMMRNSYKAFSSVLVGGGLAIFYFSIALAFHEYALFGQLTAFIIMLVITAFAVLLSLLYDRQELAIIALVGGFVSPFIASNGSGDYKSLFLYLLILNTGLLVIAYFKAWRLLNLLAFVFTCILFGSWLFSVKDPAAPVLYGNGLIYATLFYVLFFVINIAHTIRENKRFIASDFGILLANTCVYFGAGLYLLNRLHEDNKLGLFSACMAFFNLGASYFLFRKKKVDANILYLLIGITLSFVSLTAPIQLHGHYITLFWAAETVLLYWLYRKSGIKILRVASVLVWGAMLISLFMDWANIYFHVDYPSGSHPLPVFFNKGLLTTLFASASCFSLFRLRDNIEINLFLRYRNLFAGILLLFAGGMLEIEHQFNSYYPATGLVVLYQLFYVYGWFVLVSKRSMQWKWLSDRRYSNGLLAANLLLYLFFIREVYEIQVHLLGAGHFILHFLAHWAGDFLVGWTMVELIARSKAGPIITAASRSLVAWLLCGVIVIFLSVELLLIVNQLFYRQGADFSSIRQLYIKTALPILWGLCSFGFMWVGMRKKYRTLRIISLCLFSITLLKLFLIDIRNIPVAGKIAAFFCLGILLLVVSFMYQRLRKILVAEDGEKAGDEKTGNGHDAIK